MLLQSRQLVPHQSPLNEAALLPQAGRTQSSPSQRGPSPKASQPEQCHDRATSPVHPQLDLAALQAQAEMLEMQARLATEEAEREAEQQCLQLFDQRGVRVTHACEHCRQRKAKCSGTQPCNRCTRSGRLCHFTIVEKKRKVTTDVRGRNAMSSAHAGGYRAPSFAAQTALARRFGSRYSPLSSNGSPDLPSTMPRMLGLPNASVMEYSGSQLIERLHPASEGLARSNSMPLSPAPPSDLVTEPHAWSDAVVGFGSGDARLPHFSLAVPDWQSQSASVVETSGSRSEGHYSASGGGGGGSPRAGNASYLDGLGGSAAPLPSFSFDGQPRPLAMSVVEDDCRATRYVSPACGVGADHRESWDEAAARGATKGSSSGAALLNSSGDVVALWR
ncbi:uncharacterized protein PFL1_01135 [Pseudozyma flocculosa PF-1]|uniref:uncharacterized protein n=1 Tax=Pseudozyma flocculosa PF-1 TaxID=1277687 RepID=UPI00045609B9|nr:uncharacterized protein PFL1_01135 [Pseudozyma flocculosa PF-1]EPQ30946.1 hypothetical protein PFL1_01135 [Pseudozyma flocculosa PF-1]